MYYNAMSLSHDCIQFLSLFFSLLVLTELELESANWFKPSSENLGAIPPEFLAAGIVWKICTSFRATGTLAVWTPLTNSMLNLAPSLSLATLTSYCCHYAVEPYMMAPLQSL